MTDLTVLSSSPSPIHAHPSTSFISGSNPHSPGFAFTTGPRFASRSLLNLSATAPSSSLHPARASTSQLTVDTSVHSLPNGGHSRPRTISEHSTSPSPSPLRQPVRRASFDSPGTPHGTSADEDAQINGHSHPPLRRNSSYNFPTSESPTTYLSPPLEHRRPSPRPHSPKRALSAPPERIEFDDDQEEEEDNAILYNDQFGTLWKKRPKPNVLRSKTLYSPSSSNLPEGDLRELLPPPPPLLRPTTFWRHTQRSGVSGASYSPSSHLVRRSTFVAAGLSYETPGHDLSALCVESRVVRNKVVVKPGEQLVISLSGSSAG